MTSSPAAGSGGPDSGLPSHGSFGQSYVPPAYGQLPTGPPPPPPPPTPPRQSKVGIVVAVVVVLVTAVAGLVLVLVTKQQTVERPNVTDVAVGACVAVDALGRSKDASVARAADCSDADALWRVAANLDSTSAPCPDGDYDEYHFAAGNKLCLTLNVKAGDCLAHLDTGLADIEKVNCAEPSAEVAVVAVRDGVTDAVAVCEDVPDAAGGVFYSEPARVLCLGYPRSV
ncbi:hypothetical protein [Saccharomonospora sp. NB11]|uniref:LppU/SCO3897 family protein n=1 Tax=Saccharomonospora sp. NB11 TaxID=1642298 RepID=UPI0027DE6828|nr:hypothetical protein [Saccharomonospora sp. NB11]